MKLPILATIAIALLILFGVIAILKPKPIATPSNAVPVSEVTEWECEPPYCKG